MDYVFFAYVVLLFISRCVLCSSRPTPPLISQLENAIYVLSPYQEKMLKRLPALRMARCTWTGIFGSPHRARFVSVTTELFFAMKSSVKMCWSVRTHRCPQESAVQCVPIPHVILTLPLVSLLPSSLLKGEPVRLALRVKSALLLWLKLEQGDCWGVGQLEVSMQED